MVARALGKQRRVIMRPSAQHLSEAEKAAARARVEARWAGGPKPAPAPTAGGGTVEAAQRSPLYPRVATIMRKAEQRAPSLPAGARARLDVLLLEMRAALIANDERALQTVEEALINLLFEVT